ncbi:unnamed protein product [Aphanomyces euteiches]|uniref:Peptidase M24 domain-containing protein n=1 Tax=Aphanomyces euteiches TaxID=100861 RepID=A0A6G0XU55_9STRA|nr:hypothetical protein Ae201684_001318 [Aphanomyces euteiches]KAH9099808.1 hypothetical protein Ae201684P_018818 [Aphanomyces euteiches]KAH9139629.1 hypothetical protein AeRB84_016106 [Aphanomyces euteiches]
MPSPPYYAPFHEEPTGRAADFELKLKKLRALLTELKANAGVLSLANNFAWLTGGGRNHIFQATEGGVGSIYVDRSRAVLVANNIEGHRFLNEELAGLPLEILEASWYEAKSVQTAAATLSSGGSVLFDTDPSFDSALCTLRQDLSPFDIERYRLLGKDCSAVLSQVAHTVRPGLTEWEIGAAIAQRCVTLAIDVVVLLIAADDRADTIRHPLPTTKKVVNKVMLVLCGRRGGLIANLTRMVHVSSDSTIPADLRRRHDAVTYVDAASLAATRIGVSAADVLRAIQDAYASQGFPNEWTLHHQGGVSGYKGREWLATPSTTTPIKAFHAYAWNPSIAGTKSEDTILLHENGEVEILTKATDEWPLVRHTINGKEYARPDILHIQV